MNCLRCFSYNATYCDRCHSSLQEKAKRIPAGAKKTIEALREEIKDLKWENKDMSIEIKELKQEARKGPSLDPFLL
jgi:predicted RNase H-like nuclease (RuvC/YqgF family)